MLVFSFDILRKEKMNIAYRVQAAVTILRK